jgi:hypothetical protein
MDGVERWLVNTGARMVVGGPGSPQRPCWEHRLVGGALLRLGVLVMRWRHGLW